MIELALLGALTVAGAILLFVVAIRVGMLIGVRLDRWLQRRYAAEQAELADAATRADVPPEPVAEETTPR